MGIGINWRVSSTAIPEHETLVAGPLLLAPGAIDPLGDVWRLPLHGRRGSPQVSASKPIDESVYPIPRNGFPNDGRDVDLRLRGHLAAHDDEPRFDHGFNGHTGPRIGADDTRPGANR